MKSLTNEAQSIPTYRKNEGTPASPAMWGVKVPAEQLPHLEASAMWGRRPRVSGRPV
jgi:hypothetical protein